jgi:hypothetical protein
LEKIKLNQKNYRNGSLFLPKDLSENTQTGANFFKNKISCIQDYKIIGKEEIHLEKIKLNQINCRNGILFFVERFL